MMKLTLSVLVFGIVIQLPTSYSAPLCDTDEYWQSVLGRCLPCQPICVPLMKKDCQRLCWKFIISSLSKQTSTKASGSGTSKQIINTSHRLASSANKASDLTNSQPSTDAVPQHKDIAKAAKSITILVIICAVFLSLSVVAILVYCFRQKICPSVIALCERNRPTVLAQEEEGTPEETVALSEV